jgi:NADPH:quinone reductase-like Zn-dependent oxidoreductase
MRRVVVTRHGPPEVLRVEEQPDPAPGEGAVRIRVRAVGVNFADILMRLGLYPGLPRPPFVPGLEVAGRVDGTGGGVGGLADGDRVVALMPLGAYADLVVCPASRVFRAPAGLSDAEAAAVPVAYATAALALHTLANLAPGETVLVQNAGGGVGTAAVQLAKLRRAIVIGTASAAKHPALQGLGVDHLVDYRHEPVAEAVRRITRGRGVDVVLDPIGGESIAAGYRLLAPLGRLVTFGLSSAVAGERRSLRRAFRAWRRQPRFTPLGLMRDNRAVIGLSLGNLLGEPRLASVMRDLSADFETRRLRPVVSRVFPLERAADAHRFVHARRNVGKVVLVVD